MEMKETYKTYDKVVYTAFLGLFSKGLHTGTIRLVGFNPNDTAHLAIFSIAHLVANSFKYKIEVCCPFYKYIWFKLTKRQKVKIKWTRQLEDSIHVQSFINQIVKVEEVNPNIFREIYEVYYK